MQALIVDDSEIMCQMVSITLKEIGFKTTISSNGKDALKQSNKIKFNVIVTDINMPSMNGIDLIKNLRFTGQNKFTPILVLTSQNNEEVKNKSKESGANGWIEKPFKPKVLASAVKKVCNL